MIKRTIALATLAAFLVFSWSCAIYSWEKKPLQSVKPEKRAEVEISAVQDHSGKITEFRRKPGAGIQGDSVTGIGIFENRFLEKSRIIQPTLIETGAPVTIVTKDGLVYKTDRIIAQTDSQIILDEHFIVSIPLTDVDFLWIKELNFPASLLLIVAVPLAIIGILIGYMAVSGQEGFI